MSKRIIDGFSEFYGYNYADSFGPNGAKTDQVGVPDFAAGAMENWGLVTYREQSLLYDMNRDRFDRKYYVCSVVAHEMAHMWFGDFVTCEFWDELWLNEAFASYITYVGLEASDNR